MSRSNASRRKAPEVHVPDFSEDAAERKRALNVLAQRRYRQRKREHITRLEKRANGSQAKDSDQATGGPDTPETDLLSPQDYGIVNGPGTGAETVQIMGTDSSNLDLSTENFNPMAFDDMSMSSNDLTLSWIGISGLTPLPSPSPQFTQLWDNTLPGLSPRTPDTNHTTPSPSSTQPPSNTATTTSIFQYPISTFPITPSSSSSSSATTTTFPHSPSPQPNLRVLELDLLNAGMTIARALNIDSILWSLDSTSPFASNPNPTSASSPSFPPPPPPTTTGPDLAHLPPNLHPTAVQRTFPHHPLIDILPWPSVRDKLILILSQPPHLRPPSASSPTALLEFVYDIEDPAEGVRVTGGGSGGDCMDGRNWEVGEAVWRNWWWAFDRGIVRRSNWLRRERGAGPLGTGMVVGEVQ